MPSNVHLNGADAPLGAIVPGVRCETSTTRSPPSDAALKSSASIASTLAVLKCVCHDSSVGLPRQTMRGGPFRPARSRVAASSATRSRIWAAAPSQGVSE